MAKTLSNSGITSLGTVRPGHVSQSVDALTGAEAYDITISGSLTLTGSFNFTPGLTGSFTGSFTGDGSGLTGIGGDSFPYTGSAIISGSLQLQGQVYIDIPTTHIPTGTTQTIDWNNGNIQVIDLDSATGNVTLTLSNPQTGGTYSLKLIQGATARNITWPGSMLWEGGTSLILSTGNDDIDLVTMVYDGTNYLASYGTNFS